MNYSDTIQLLQQYYNLTSEKLLHQREKSEWKPANNFGFLLGIIAQGLDVHITQLHNLLITKQFKEQEQPFIDSMLDFYIRPFHKSYYNDSECCQITSKISVETELVLDGVFESSDLDYIPEELEHNDLEKAVNKRDGVCLFCWDKLQCEAAHIFVQKEDPFAFDELSLFRRTGLKQKHQAQNGLLLCIKCQSQFNKLKRYVDIVDDKLVVKIVNETSDKNDVNYRRATIGLNGSRRDQLEFILDNRQVIEANGEMALYFVQNNPTKLPNRKALEFHKTACLIWRMAGGAESDEEYCSDDDDLGPVDTASLRKRFNIQDSAESLNIVS